MHLSVFVSATIHHSDDDELDSAQQYKVIVSGLMHLNTTIEEKHEIITFRPNEKFNLINSSLVLPDWRLESMLAALLHRSRNKLTQLFLIV